MPILGIGIDLSDVSRLETAARRTPGVLERVFTEAELEYCLKKRHPYEHLAARFAAKEAFIKVIGRRIPWKSMEVVRGPAGKPALRVEQQYLPRADTTLHLSLTHERSMAAAVVVAESP